MLVDKTKILIFYEYFPPAFKSGGITRSIYNLSFFLNSFVDVYVFTGSQDLNSRDHLNVTTDCWQEYHANLNVFYAKDMNDPVHIKKILLELRPDVVYINGLFTPRYSFIPLLFKKNLPFNCRWVIAPRGMLQVAALAVKPFKKIVYLNIMKSFNLFDGVIWHAIGAQERLDIARFGVNEKNIRLASDIPSVGSLPELHLHKEKNCLSIVFFALISPVKNLDGLIKVLKKIPKKFSVRFDIYGAIKDQAYWSDCLSLISDLPGNISINYKGLIKPEDSHEILKSYHILGLLTKGENFGHSIFESLYAGTPVLISTMTPWRNLELERAGWDLDLNDLSGIGHKIQEIASWDDADYRSWRYGARAYAEKFFTETKFEEQYRELFEFK